MTVLLKGSFRPCKGAYKAPRWLVLGEEMGVSIRLTFRSLKAAQKVLVRPGVKAEIHRFQ